MAGKCRGGRKLKKSKKAKKARAYYKKNRCKILKRARKNRKKGGVGLFPGVRLFRGS